MVAFNEQSGSLKSRLLCPPPKLSFGPNVTSVLVQLISLPPGQFIVCGAPPAASFAVRYIKVFKLGTNEVVISIESVKFIYLFLILSLYLAVPLAKP